jgi:hypothetical protein
MTKIYNSSKFDITQENAKEVFQRYKKYVYGVEGDIPLETMLEIHQPFFYSLNDHKILHIPPPPKPPISVIVPSIPNSKINQENLKERREINLNQYSHIEITEKDIYQRPHQKDGLFWCIYIAVYGIGEYIQIDRNYGIKELELKQKIAEDIQKNPQKYKQIDGYRITKTVLQEVMSDLLTQQKETSIYCMMIMMIYFKIQIRFVYNEGKYVDFKLLGEGERIHLIYIEQGNYGNRYKLYFMEEEYVIKKKAFIDKNYLHIENYFKPVKSISSYKLEELESMVKKMSSLVRIDDFSNKKMKKTDYYNIVVNNLQIP